MWKSQIQIFGGKMKFDFLGYFASFLTFLEHLDGGEACKIQNKLKFGWKNEIWNIQAYLGFLAKIPKFFKVRIYHPKYIFLYFTRLPTIRMLQKCQKWCKIPKEIKFHFPAKNLNLTFSHPNLPITTINWTYSTSSTVDFPK